MPSCLGYKLYFCQVKCMSNNKSMYYEKIYNKIFKILGDLTPLKGDCGKLCDRACCKGDKNTGMLLFPFEETKLDICENEVGEKVAVCNGKCDRTSRPLACRIFPFFPTIDENGKIFVEPDYRGVRLCPMVEHFDEIIFDKKFLSAVKKVGKILSKDKVCREFLHNATAEIDTFYEFYKVR